MTIRKLLTSLVCVGIATLSPIAATEVVTQTPTETITPQYSLYPTCGVVSELNETNDLVIFTDFNGNEWSFKGIEDWAEGDIVSAIMSDNCTPESIYDDIIVQTRYCGWVY